LVALDPGLGGFGELGVVAVVGGPRRLHRDANGRVVLQRQRDEVVHALVGGPGRRQRQHVHRAGLQRLLGLVLPVGQVPVLPGAGAAEELAADELVVLVTRRPCHAGERGGDEDVEAVAADEHALPLVKRRGGRLVARRRRVGRGGGEQGQAGQRRHEQRG